MELVFQWSNSGRWEETWSVCKVLKTTKVCYVHLNVLSHSDNFYSPCHNPVQYEVFFSVNFIFENLQTVTLWIGTEFYTFTQWHLISQQMIKTTVLQRSQIYQIKDTWIE